jgi:hypothetical protein
MFLRYAFAATPAAAGASKAAVSAFLDGARS